MLAMARAGMNRMADEGEMTRPPQDLSSLLQIAATRDIPHAQCETRWGRNESNSVRNRKNPIKSMT